MSVVSWPREDDPGCLGEKAQGLLDLAAIGLRTPATLVIRDSAIRGGAALVAVVGAILEFVAALPGPRRAVSLRCAVKHGPDKVAVLPESLLDLGLSDAVLRRAQDGRVCTAHARAFFGFFSEVAPERFERCVLSLNHGSRASACDSAMMRQMCAATMSAKMTPEMRRNGFIGSEVAR